MKRLLSVIDSVNNWSGKTASFLVLLIVGAVLTQVISRFMFHFPVIWSHDVVVFAFSVYTMMLGGYCLLHKRHIRIDILWSRISPKKQAILNLATAVLPLVFLGFLVWYAIPYAWNSIMIGERLIGSPWRPPVYVVKVFIVIGALFFFLQWMRDFIHNLYIVRGVQADK